jgi:hypothetical protein
VAPGKQLAGYHRTDIAGTAGDKDRAHGSSLPPPSRPAPIHGSAVSSITSRCVSAASTPPWGRRAGHHDRVEHVHAHASRGEQEGVTRATGGIIGGGALRGRRSRRAEGVRCAVRRGDSLSPRAAVP